MRRRDALIIGGVLVAASAVSPILRRLPAEFEFHPLAGFDGFRRLDQSPVTGVADPFMGLTGNASPPPPPGGALCDILFGPEPTENGVVPVAVFTDINCPNCAALENRLLRLEQETGSIALHWHPYPVLGPRSVWGAQITLAAQEQGAMEDVHRDLMQRVLPPGPAGVRDLSQRHNLDADQLFRDAQSNRIRAKIGSNLALGAALGIPGTPGTMIGRTLVIGAISTRDIERLVALELTAGPLPC